MTFELRAVDRVKLYTAIVDQLVEGIESGAFPPGKALPAERTLAERLNVSRGSLREAIRLLEHAGVVDVRTGSGTYVTGAGVTKFSALRARAALSGEHSPLDVVLARRALEPVCAELAASNRKPGDLTTLGRLVAEHERILGEGGDPEAVDIGIHVAIATATHNSVLLTLIENLVEMMRASTWRTLRGRSRTRPGFAFQILEQHRTIYERIEAQDCRGASGAMLAHLRSVESGLFAEVD
jgi:GntR family transcriptional repressor for pyruvate dehydrogenase complex